MIGQIAAAAGAGVSAVLGGMAQVHSIREGVKLGAATRNDLMFTLQHQIRQGNEAIKQNRELAKQNEENERKLFAEQEKISREALEMLERDKKAQQLAEQEILNQQANLQKIANETVPSLSEPDGFRMPIWGWAAIGGGSLLLLTSVFVMSRSK